MPTTEYRCKECSYTFSRLTFKGDVIAPICPQCQSTDIISRPNEEGFMSGPGLGSHITGVPKGPS